MSNENKTVTTSKLPEGRVFNIVGVTKFGDLLGDKSIQLYLIKISFGLNEISFHLDCDGVGSTYDPYPDVCKPRGDGADWDRTIFLTKEAGFERAREILAKEFPAVDLSAITA
ncbi:MAG: hypothetical protein V4713_03820 [Pseudomonadota bacterium]